MFTQTIVTPAECLKVKPLASRSVFPTALAAILTLPAKVLLFSMLVFPMVRDLLYVKAALFAVLLLVVSFRALMEKRLALHRTVVVWALFLAAVSCYFVLKGFESGAPGSGNAAQLYVLWPLIYLVLISGLTKWRMFIWIQRVLVFATIFVGVYGLIFSLTQLGILPAYLYVQLFDQGESMGIYSGYTRMSLYSLDSMPFLLPFVIAALATYSTTDKKNIVSGMWLCLAAILGTGLTLITARRGLALAVGATPLFVLLFQCVQPPSGRRLTKKLLILAALTSIVVGQILYFGKAFDFNMGSFEEYFAEGFGLGQGQDLGAYVRREQYSALISGWAEHPVLGAGLGAGSRDYISSAQHPWSYELYYLALLYQTGLAGMLAYTAGVAWIYWVGIKIIKAGGAVGNTMLPLLVGLTCFLVVNATNPILARFDGFWAIFLPVALINFWLRNRSKRSPVVAGQFATRTGAELLPTHRPIKG